VYSCLTQKTHWWRTRSTFLNSISDRTTLQHCTKSLSKMAIFYIAKINQLASSAPNLGFFRFLSLVQDIIRRGVRRSRSSGRCIEITMMSFKYGAALIYLTWGLDVRVNFWVLKYVSELYKCDNSSTWYTKYNYIPFFMHYVKICCISLQYVSYMVIFWASIFRTTVPPGKNHWGRRSGRELSEIASPGRLSLEGSVSGKASFKWSRPESLSFEFHNSMLGTVFTSWYKSSRQCIVCTLATVPRLLRAAFYHEICQQVSYQLFKRNHSFVLWPKLCMYTEESWKRPFSHSNSEGIHLNRLQADGLSQLFSHFYSW
jgi:hypothetical protein